MTEPITSPASAKLLRIAIWVAIGALIAAALVCVVWVLFGPESGIVGRAFLTILLLASFAGISILETQLAPRRPAWFALASMAVWVVTLLIGAFMIWMPEPDRYFGIGADRFFRFLLIVLVLQLALLHVRLFTKLHARYSTTFTTIVTYVTIALVVILAIMLVIPLIVSEFYDFLAVYWRIVVSLAILAAVGTALVPLVNALLAPKRPRPAGAPHAGSQAAPYGGSYATPQLQTQPAPQWPTYADGYTPLPVMPDGSPDWNAYYTGYPTYAQPAYAAVEQTQPSARATEQTPEVEPQPEPHPESPATQDDFPSVPPRPPLPPRP
ncbi:hypothetical protein H9651_00565 [Microbacterium sp. Sa4CUA7]|uniref:Agglutinin receptor n=1 Tax=Microbacterium pullorum TaxID=2762236 RepID=A0ABR8RY14_9MICO|nr:hypothetical protein [Microbacterium pullorum]MBD7956130.1 hypothetical protein [Microbacterium pullorum]